MTTIQIQPKLISKDFSMVALATCLPLAKQVAGVEKFNKIEIIKSGQFDVTSELDFSVYHESTTNKKEAHSSVIVYVCQHENQVLFSIKFMYYKAI